MVKKVGGTIDDTELVDGLALTQNISAGAGGPTRMEKAKIALVQFQLSSPKPDVSPPVLSLSRRLCLWLDWVMMKAAGWRSGW